MLNTNVRQRFADYQARHFQWTLADGIATITLNRPERKNPLTMDSYAELRELFRGLPYARAATCTRSSVRWWRWRCRSCSSSRG
jgi:1,4-dihydroxy-2-naphthoyl-CoA synthase